MFDRLRALGESVLNPREREKVAKEAAIAEWENNLQVNPEGLKVVRGKDGKAVEAVSRGKSQMAYIVNGEERIFQINELLGLAVRNLCLDGVLKNAYDVQILQGLSLGDNKIDFYVLGGVSYDNLPAGLLVFNRGS